MTRIKRVGPAILIAFTFALAASAADPETSVLKGAVEDESGAAIPGAKVRLTNTSTNKRLDTTSDEVGHFELTGLPNADYVLSVKSKGFDNFSRHFAVGHIPKTPVRVLLDIAENAQSIVVSGASNAASASETLASVGLMSTFSGICPSKTEN